MSARAAFSEYFQACAAAAIGITPETAGGLAPALSVVVDKHDWRRALTLARQARLRFCGLWAQQCDPGFEVLSCLETRGGYLVLRAILGPHDTLASAAPVYAVADRLERHAHDLLGVRFYDQPDGRRWVRHRAWRHDEYPLRAEFPRLPATAEPAAADVDYPFIQAQGAGVVEIPVGPVHAGIIEPGHFRFQAIGETILNLEERLGYTHKGIEKIAVGRDAPGLARLAGRVSGDSTVAHAWAACQALERAAGVEPPPRALWLRAIMLERERVANHLGDIGAICNDVAFAFAQSQLTRLKEQWVRASHAAFGHRFMMDCVVPGGVAPDLSSAAARAMAEVATSLAGEVAGIIEITERFESLEDRLMGTGRLTPEVARDLGVLGYLGRASGHGFDVRRDAPHPPYDRFTVAVPGYRAGDVAARAKVRSEEIGVSLDLIRRLIETLPQGPLATTWPAPPCAGEGLGLVEGWRGEILSYVRLDDDGRIARFFPRDPSWCSWPALELLVQGNIVPDFPVCNKSVNASYAGQDL